MMELILDGAVKKEHSIVQGNYTLAEELVNGFHYWNQQDGKYALWSVLSSYWMIGKIEELGNLRGFIAVQFGSKVWPTQILHGFMYSTSSWHSALSNEVLFKDCKYNRLSF